MSAIPGTLTISRRPFVIAFAVTIALGFLPFSAGCGSSVATAGNPTTPGSSLSRGRATFTIVWPEPTRLIPSASNSIVISLTSKGTEGILLGTQTVSRPPGGQGTSVVAFENMEPGSLVAIASAFPNSDGTGVAQASGQVPVTIVADETAETSLTMNSTIDRLEVSPPAFRYYHAKRPSFNAGDPVTVTARNSTGDVVLVPATNYTWTSSAASNAFVRVTGTEHRVYAVGPVSITTLTVRENESGKTAELPVDIHGPLYNVIDLGEQITTTGQSEAYAINETGAVVGFAVLNNRPQAVIWQNGNARNIGLPPGFDSSFARDINDNGVIVGNGAAGTAIPAPNKGFVWKQLSTGTGQFTLVPPPPSYSTSSLLKINNHGIAAGGEFYQVVDGSRGFTFDTVTQKTTLLPALNLEGTTRLAETAHAINDSGAITGTIYFQNTIYLYDKGTAIATRLFDGNAINAEGAVAGSRFDGGNYKKAAIFKNNAPTYLFPTGQLIASVAYGLNNKGSAVGVFDLSSSISPSWRAFVWGPGLNGNPNESTPELLNYLIDPASGWQLQIARDINDRGEIVGVGVHNGRRSAFLLTPIPWASPSD